MWKPSSVAIVLMALGLAGASAAAHSDIQADARLTDVENRWLAAASPVLDYAEERHLPIDIIVQPTARPGDAPLAMGFDGGRCKLVLSLRGNSDPESVLTGIEPMQADLAIEIMVAHEVAHCWRYLNGSGPAWLAGFSSVKPATTSGEAAGTQADVQARQEMQQTRREEGFADLFGLAWALRRHSQDYARLHAWLEHVRENNATPGSHHDTRPWIELARDTAAFDAEKTLFEQAQALWAQGLRAGS